MLVQNVQARRVVVGCGDADPLIHAREMKTKPKHPIATDPKLQAEAVEFARRGFTAHATAKAMGIAFSTFRNHQDSIPGFEEAYRESMETRIDRVSQSALELTEKAMSGELEDMGIALKNPNVMVACLRALSPRFGAAAKVHEFKGVTMADIQAKLDPDGGKDGGGGKPDAES